MKKQKVDLQEIITALTEKSYGYHGIEEDTPSYWYLNVHKKNADGEEYEDAIIMRVKKTYPVTLQGFTEEGYDKDKTERITKKIVAQLNRSLAKCPELHDGHDKAWENAMKGLDKNGKPMKVDKI
jgi:hypothetical protein